MDGAIAVGCARLLERVPARDNEAVGPVVAVVDDPAPGGAAAEVEVSPAGSWLLTKEIFWLYPNVNAGALHS